MRVRSTLCSATQAEWFEILHRTSRRNNHARSVRFVFQFTEYLAERSIRNVFGKIMVLHHSSHVQSFDKDRLVLADDLCRKILKRVSASVADFGVQPRYLESGFLAIITAINLARQATLKVLQPLFAPEERARVFKFFAIAGRGQGL